MADEIHSCTTLAIASGLIGSLLGYGVRYWLAQRSARRKEDWDQLRELTNHINELVDESVAFFCVKETDSSVLQKKAIRLQRLISVSGQKSFALSKSLGDFSVEGFHKRLRQAITQEGFDADISRPILNPNDEKIIAIENASNSLIGALDRSFSRAHRGGEIVHIC